MRREIKLILIGVPHYSSRVYPPSKANPEANLLHFALAFRFSLSAVEQ